MPCPTGVLWDRPRRKPILHSCNVFRLFERQRCGGGSETQLSCSILDCFLRTLRYAACSVHCLQQKGPSNVTLCSACTDRLCPTWLRCPTALPSTSTNKARTYSLNKLRDIRWHHTTSLEPERKREGHVIRPTCGMTSFASICCHGLTPIAAMACHNTPRIINS